VKIALALLTILIKVVGHLFKITVDIALGQYIVWISTEELIMFALAHKLTREDRAFDSSKSYAYYFRLHLLNLHAEARIARTGMGTGFQIHEGRVWA